MDEFIVTISKVPATKDVPTDRWCAKVVLRQPGDVSYGILGHSYIGETPQIALASLAVFWASYRP